MLEILPGVYNFRNLLVGRVYAIQDPDGLTIIDAGLGLAASRILQQLNAAGYALTDVKRILITHAHADHIAGLPALKAATGATVIASVDEAPLIEAEGTPVDRTVNDGDILNEVMGGLQVVLTPGHTPGHTAFWQPQQRVLFCGDAIMHFFALTGPFRFVSPDMPGVQRSIQKLAGLAPQVVCFGHGRPLYNAAEPIAAFAARFKI